MEGSSLQSTRPGPIRRVLSRATLAVVATGALVAGGMVAAAAPSSAATPHASGNGTAAAGPAVGDAQHLCATPAKGQMACMSLARTNVAHHLGITPNATPSGYGPTDLQSAYALPSGGSGQTVAIVDAQDDPNAEADLATYRSQYGLPACTTANGCFKKVDENGGTSYPTADSGWAGEISLDLDMVSAVCPQLPHPARRGDQREHGRPGHRGEPRGHPGRQVRLQQLRRQRGLHRHLVGLLVLQPPRRGHHRQLR